MKLVPHIVQYQGSKRILAPQILKFLPEKFNRLLEPFSGMAAITIATATEQRANHYHINDINSPLVNLLQECAFYPERLITNYSKVWNEQFEFSDGHIKHFFHIRDLFNDGEKTPENMLYLLARCVKGAVRYGKDGKFNQSLDKRRHGTKPSTIKENVMAFSNILKNKVSFSSIDYHEVFEMAKTGDIVYMDPPYQGVSNVRDCRYLSGINYDEFVSAIDSLNKKGIDFLISYDGKCGETEYGKDLPPELNCTKILLNAGLSTQATFLGKKETTFEALYISKGLSHYIIPPEPEMDLFGGAI